MKPWFCCLLWCICLPAFPARPEVVVARADVGALTVYAVSASASVSTAPAQVWQVLTDYERMPEFVPDLETASVLAREDNEVLLDQTGLARLLFLSRPIHLVVRVTEQAPTSIDIALVAGDMKYYVCHWELQALAPSGGTRVLYSGKLAPAFYVPDLLGPAIVRADVERMMAALVARLERRAPAN